MLRKLTERARVGGLKLTGEGGLLGKLTKMVIGAPWKAEPRFFRLGIRLCTSSSSVSVPEHVSGPVGHGS
jgi:hypothetical protein